MLFFGVFWLFATIIEKNEFIGRPLLESSNPWSVWLIRILGLLFVLSLLTFGYHELFDAIQTFTCKKCGGKVTRQRPPITRLPKIFFTFLAISLFTFAVLLVVLINVS